MGEGERGRNRVTDGPLVGLPDPLAAYIYTFWRFVYACTLWTHSLFCGQVKPTIPLP